MLVSSFICIIWSCFSNCEASHIVKTHIVFWNSSNPIFRLDNTDHVIDVNENNSPMEYDQLNLICPHNSSEEGEEEHHIIYIVTREEFQACQVRGKKPKIVAVCNQPRKFQYFTITFRNFSPTPGGLEFRPGQTYYLISTSALGDIARREGGFCSSHNMKIIFKVADHQRKSEPVTVRVEEAEISPDVGVELLTLMPAIRGQGLNTTPPPPDRATSSAPQYFYRSKTLRKMPTEINYFYSLRDLFQLRKAFIEKIGKNETLKAEKLLSSSGSNHIEILNNIICLSTNLLFALQLV